MDIAARLESRSTSFLTGGGEISALIAAFDWSATSLGPIEDWPQVLKTTVGLILRSPVPIVTLWGEDGVMIYNDGYARFAGRRHPAILGTKVREGWPEVADFNDNVMKTVLGRGETLSYQDQELTLDRSGTPERAWMNLNYSPVVDDDGDRVGVFITVVETTDKVRAEQASRDERGRLQRMFDETPGFMALVEGRDHRFVIANAAYRELIGGRDVIGQTVAEALPEVVGQGFIDLLHQVYDKREPFVGRAVSVEITRGGAAPERRFVDFIYQPIVDAEGAANGIFVQGFDVTDHKRSELMRDLQNRVLELAIDERPLPESLDALVRAVEEHSSNEIIGSILLMNEDGVHLHHGAGPNLPDAYNEAIDGIAIGASVGSCGTAAFTRKPVYVSDIASDPLWADFRDLALSHGLRACWSTPILAGSGDVLGTFAIYSREPREPHGDDLELVRLITQSASLVIERKRAQEALKKSNETLEARVAEEIAERQVAEAALHQAQKMESIGKLTGGVAHDFNNLLQIISGNLQLLEMTIGDDEKSRRRISNALAGVERGAKLANQLLAFARRQPLAPKVTNIGRLVVGMEDLLRRSIGEAVEVETLLADDCKAHVDPTQIENAILNLAINARDAMERSGKLRIEVFPSRVEAGAADAGELAPGDYVAVAVSDSGCGIPPEALNQVFEPFFSTKPEGQGTGLGLSMVYGFAKQSGGHATIASDVGKGTTVTLYLPRVTEEEAGEVSAEARQVERGQETILLVEDDERVRDTAVEMLEGLGYTVATAPDAMAALALIDGGARPDLLFTDVVMPGDLRSPDLARMARERIPGLPVLFTSGYAENAVVHGGKLDAGVDLLAKPYARETLAHRVREALDR